MKLVLYVLCFWVVFSNSLGQSFPLCETTFDSDISSLDLDDYALFKLKVRSYYPSTPFSELQFAALYKAHLIGSDRGAAYGGYSDAELNEKMFGPFDEAGVPVSLTKEMIVKGILGEPNFSSSSNYERLGVSSTATEQEIIAAHRMHALKYHPDRNRNSEESIRLMKILNNAKDDLLKNKHASPSDAGNNTSTGASSSHNSKSEYHDLPSKDPRFNEAFHRYTARYDNDQYGKKFEIFDAGELVKKVMADSRHDIRIAYIQMIKSGYEKGSWWKNSSEYSRGDILRNVLAFESIAPHFLDLFLNSHPSKDQLLEAARILRQFGTEELAKRVYAEVMNAPSPEELINNFISLVRNDSMRDWKIEDVVLIGMKRFNLTEEQMLTHVVTNPLLGSGDHITVPRDMGARNPHPITYFTYVEFELVLDAIKGSYISKLAKAHLLKILRDRIATVPGAKQNIDIHLYRLFRNDQAAVDAIEKDEALWSSVYELIAWHSQNNEFKVLLYTQKSGSATTEFIAQRAMQEGNDDIRNAYVNILKSAHSRIKYLHYIRASMPKDEHDKEIQDCDDMAARYLELFLSHYPSEEQLRAAASALRLFTYDKEDLLVRINTVLSIHAELKSLQINRHNE